MGPRGGDVAATAEEILFYEELSLNCWPPRARLFHDGWVAGLSEGYTRRANCVFPLRDGGESLGGKVDWCERTLESQWRQPGAGRAWAAG